MQPRQFIAPQLGGKFNSICISVFLVVICGLSFSNKINAQGKCLIVSDIHFNPFYINDKIEFDTVLVEKLKSAEVADWEGILDTVKMQSLGPDFRGNDADYDLLMSAIENMQHTVAKPDFIIIAGDLIWHNYIKHVHEPKIDLILKEKTIQFIADLFHQKFPGTPIIPVLGNNDADGDYLKQSTEFLASFANAWRLSDLKVQTDYFTNNSGNYTASIGQLKLIVLNTALMSAGAISRHYDNYADGYKILNKWFGPALGDAQQPVWIISHIPPGFNGYDSSYNWATKEKESALSKVFTKIIVENNKQIKFMVAGHTHMNDFKVFYKGADTTANSAIAYMRIVPSISPVHYNNPSFEVAEFDSSYHVINETNYYLDLKKVLPDMAYKELQWSETLNMKTLFDLNDITPETLSKLVDSMNQSTKQSEGLRAKYAHFFGAGYSKNGFENPELSKSEGYLKAERENEQP